MFWVILLSMVNDHHFICVHQSNAKTTLTLCYFQFNTCSIPDNKCSFTLDALQYCHLCFIVMLNTDN